MVKLLKASQPSPIVSVVFPIYNSALHLRKSIESLLSQTYKNFEIIAINDGSTDTSRDILLSYKDQRIKYFEHMQNQGLVATLNEGFALTKGKYIARMDPDDYCQKDRLEKQVKYLDGHPDISILGSWIQNFGLYTYLWRVHQTSKFITTKLLFETSVAHPSVMMRRESVLATGIKFEEKYHGAEDFMFWSKLSEGGLKFANIPQALLNYRTHPSQVGEAEKSRQQRSSLLVRLYNIHRLGLKPTSTEKEVHQKLSSWIPLTGLKEIVATGRWLRKILDANKRRRVYDSDALSTIVGEKWTIICYLSSTSNLLRVLYLLTTPQLLPLVLQTLYLRYRGKFYENA